MMVPGPADRSRRAVFGEAGLPIEPDRRRARAGASVLSGPEPACVRTAAVVAESAEVPTVPGLGGPDLGRWAGLTPERVLDADPAGLQAWLRDPDASPHGGESLAGHLRRVAGVLDSFAWPAAGAVVVASLFTVRAACVHALRAGPESLLHLDLTPGTTAAISRNGDTWRLTSILPGGR